MILRPVRPGVAHRAADHELARRVDVEEVLGTELRGVHEVAVLGVEHGLDDVLEQVGLDQRLGVEAVAVLRRDEDALDRDRALAPVLVHLVADGHLRLAVRTEVRQDVGLPDLGEPPGELVREHDRERHQLVGLVARVAEHHPLVARAHPVDRVGVAVLRLVRRVDALRDVRGLVVDRDHHAARLGVEAVLRAGVADLGDGLADDRADVDVGLGRDLAGDDDEAGRDQGLAGDAPVLVVAEDGVEDGVRDLVGDLVGVSLGDGLRRELEGARGHCGGTVPRSAD